MRCRPAGRSCIRRIAGWVLVPIAPHDLSNRPIVLPDAGEITIEIVAGRDASVNFDMQSLASLLHGDRITRAPLGAPGALPASARLELLRDPAQQAALERGVRLSARALDAAPHSSLCATS